MKTEKPIGLINVVSQVGAGRRAIGRGWYDRADYLRSYLETSGLQLAEIVTVSEPEHIDEGEPSLKHLEAVARVCNRVKHAVMECHSQSVFPVCLGGDHSLAIGSVAASASQMLDRDEMLGLLWVDAHIDMNTQQTTPSGNIHGMALATLCGLGAPLLVQLGKWEPKIDRRHALALGLRFADRTELSNLRDEGPRVVTMRDIDHAGISAVLRDSLPFVLADTGGFHLSLDLDVLEPSCAPGVNTSFPGGMTFREVRSICDTVATTGRLTSLDVVEHNPDKGHDMVMLPIIGELIAGALGASAMP